MEGRNHMEHIKLKVEEKQEKEIEKLRELLFLLKIDCKTEYENDEKYLEISYNVQKVFKKLNRSPGRKKTRMNCIALTVEEARKRIEKETAEEVAKSLGVSRRTLFRRLAEAEKRGDKYIY